MGEDTSYEDGVRRAPGFAIRPAEGIMNTRELVPALAASRLLTASEVEKSPGSRPGHPGQGRELLLRKAHHDK